MVFLCCLCHSTSTMNKSSSPTSRSEEFKKSRYCRKWQNGTQNCQLFLKHLLPCFQRISWTAHQAASVMHMRQFTIVGKEPWLVKSTTNLWCWHGNIAQLIQILKYLLNLLRFGQCICSRATSLVYYCLCWVVQSPSDYSLSCYHTT